MTNYIHLPLSRSIVYFCNKNSICLLLSLDMEQDVQVKWLQQETTVSVG